MVDLNKFPSIFQTVQNSHSRHQKTTSNLLRINLKGILKFNEIWPLEGAIYITLWQNFSFMQFSQKIDGFRQKIFTGLLEPIQLCKQTPLDKFFIFTIYQNYTLALKQCNILHTCIQITTNTFWWSNFYKLDYSSLSLCVIQHCTYVILDKSLHGFTIFFSVEDFSRDMTLKIHTPLFGRIWSTDYILFHSAPINFFGI